MNSHPFALPSLTPLIAEIDRQDYPESALYVVATPIGNVGDISLRALKVLALADAVACEDTRHTAQLLARYGLSKTLIAAHEHNEREAAARILERLQSGARIALVSDAGTPAVSDPGARIVDTVLAGGWRVVPLPGASAAIAALSAGGLTDSQFHFIGFLPAKARQRDQAILAVRDMAATLVFYEAPHRIADTLHSLAATLGGERQIVFARELTKLFETIHRCRLEQAGDWLTADGNRQKGEFVLLVQGAAPTANEDDAEAERVLKILMSECPLKQAAALAAQITGQKKNALYELALRLKGDAG